MACPYLQDIDEEKTLNNGIQNGHIEGEKKELTYSSYLELPQLLSCQNLQTEKDDSIGVHDEHLFIITHQAYELWFKQILFEIDSLRELFQKPVLDESKTLLVTRRLNRVILIQKVLVDQFAILETMTPHDFMDFRQHLSSASGFQSWQFRMLENKLGLKDENRVKYNQQNYKSALRGKEAEMVTKSISEPSLLNVVEKWLERTPGLDGEFGFWQKYKSAALNWIKENFLNPAMAATTEEEKNSRMADYKKQMEAYDSVADADAYNVFVARGDRRLSHQAFKGALFIALYREEPRFNLPFQVLTQLMDIDSMLTKWRHHHVTMVQRMLGNKIGSGGSSGYLYLRSTVSDRYKVFLDLTNLSTYLIPRFCLPPLDPALKRRLSMIT